MGSPSGLYGAERWILSLISYIDPDTVESIVCVINDAGYEDIPLCRVARERSFQTAVVDAHGKVNFEAVRALRKYNVANKIDVNHTHI